MIRTLVVLTVLAGCGARTGLPVDDAPDTAVAIDAATDAHADAPGPDASDAPFPCIVGTFPLSRARAELVLLLDRSGSMLQNIDGTSARPRRWDTLHDALAVTLPEFEARIDLGAMAFPRRFDGSLTRTCELSTALDVIPGERRSDAILAVLEHSDPWGATPTAATVDFVGNWLSARISRERSVAMVLATDGGPNCNVDADPDTCTCASSDKPCPRATACLDDVRSVETLGKFASRGVPTFVIGLDSSALPVERDALEAMARAGGRPNPAPGAPPYYSVRDKSAVQAAFRNIQEGIADCRLFMPSRPDDPEAVEIRIADTPVPRDPKHLDGWDWGSVDFGQIDLFGAACARARMPDAKAVAMVSSCRDR